MRRPLHLAPPQDEEQATRIKDTRAVEPRPPCKCGLTTKQCCARHPHSLKQPHTASHAHTLTRSHAHTLTHSHAHILTRSHTVSLCGPGCHGFWSYLHAIMQDACFTCDLEKVKLSLENGADPNTTTEFYKDSKCSAVPLTSPNGFTFWFEVHVCIAHQLSFNYSFLVLLLVCWLLCCRTYNQNKQQARC